MTDTEHASWKFVFDQPATEHGLGYRVEVSVPDSDQVPWPQLLAVIANTLELAGYSGVPTALRDAEIIE